VSVFSITSVDLVNFSAQDVYNACFDDSNDGVPAINTTAVAAVIDRGEQEVLSWLGPEYGPFTPTLLAQIGSDPALKYAALEYIILYMYDRHPEYVRSGMKDRAQRKKDADERMQRYLDARQIPPTLEPEVEPANIGGVGQQGTHTLYANIAGQPRRSGDY
jgi:hypothetical protein